METPKKPYTPKESPAVHVSYPSLHSARQELKVRLIQYRKSGPLLDIREYITEMGASFFTKKGICLNVQQIKELREILDESLKYVEHNITDTSSS